MNKDEYFACVLFASIGVGYLFPFSALTQPVDYWNLLFPDFDILFPITAVYMWINLIALGILVFVLKEKPSPKMYAFRICGGFIGQFVALTIVPSSYFLGLSEYYNCVIVISCTAFAAAVTAYIDSCAISLSSQYPVSCQEALQVGIGISTLIGSTYRLITKYSFPVDEIVQSSLLYFYAGSLTVAVCCLAYRALESLKISSECLHKFDENNINHNSNASPSITSGERSPLLHKKPNNNDVLEKGNYNTTSDHNKIETTTTYEIFKSALFNEIVVFIIFASTLIVWPGMVSEIPSFSNPVLNTTEWWPLLLLFAFAVMDVCGRFTVPYRMGLNVDNIHYAVLFRLLLLPLVVILARHHDNNNNNNIDSESYQHHLLLLDLCSMIVVSLLGFTNGYLGSLSIVLVNERVDPEHRGVVGTLTGFTLNAGLVAGATLALIIPHK